MIRRLFAVAFAVASVAGAQAPAANSEYTVRPVVGRNEAASAAAFAAAMGDMRADLRNLIMAQEM